MFSTGQLSVQGRPNPHTGRRTNEMKEPKGPVETVLIQ